jgi:hypothetical protein
VETSAAARITKTRQSQVLYENQTALPVHHAGAARALHPQLSTAFAQGTAFGYIVKPMDFDEFWESVRLIGLYWLQLNQTPKR